MTLGDLIRRYRTDANDKAMPYFASDDEVTEWLNDAVAEAAVRGRLIYVSGDAGVCRISVAAGTTVYPLHSSLYEIAHIAWMKDGATERCPIRIVSVEWLDANVSRWRDCKGAPEFAVQEDRTLRLVPEPNRPGAVLLEGYRLPKVLMEDMEDAPEINAAHHRHLVHWALHRGFSIPDSESFDPNRAQLAEQAFTAYFGERPDSDLRRITREDEAHHVQPFWL